MIRIVVGLVSWLVTNRATAQQGLKGEYYNGPDFKQKAFTRTDPQIAFDWNWQTPAPGVQREYFSVRWTGKLYAPTSGKYQFSATADDGVRVWVGGRKVIDEWRKQDDSQFLGEIILKAGQSYDLKVDYYNDWKGSAIYLFWKTPTDPRLVATAMYEMIPAVYLSPPPAGRLPKPVAASPSVVRVATLKPATKPVTAPPRAASKLATTPSATINPVAVDKPNTVTVATPKPAADPLSSLSTGETVVLRQVQFTQSSYVLLPESSTELNRLVQLMNQNPQWRIEVAGHTDNVGDPRLNLSLSENRAKVVAHYLIRRGIAEARINAKGYGSTHPVADNTAEDGRVKNRRVEITVR